MSGNNDQELDSYHLKELATPEVSHRAPYSPNSPSNPSRSITPKGTLFTNLGEAHQAITSKLATRSARHLDLGMRTQASSTDSVDSPPTAQEMESSRPTRPFHRRVMTPLLGSALPADEWNKPASNSSLAASTGSLYPSSYGGTHSAEEHRKGSAPDELDSAQENGIDTENFGNPEASRSVEMQMQAAARLNAGRNRQQMFRSTGEPPQVPLPDLPRDYRDTERSGVGSNRLLNLSPATQSLGSVSNSQELLCGDIEESRRHARDGAYQESDMSQCGASNAGLSMAGFTTDSDEDPFRYDRSPSNLFLRPAREREVSAALRCVSGGSTDSAADNIQTSPSQDPATPRPHLLSVNDSAGTGNRADRSNNPFFNKLQLYRSPEVNYEWDGEDEPSQVKISVRRHPPVPPNTPVVPEVNADESQESDNGPRLEVNNTVTSDGGDWETVATSVGMFDSNRAFPSSTAFSAAIPVKITGSSIADYSDGSSFRAARFDAFSSTDRILQHPTPGLGSSPRYRRTLKDTGRPVFPPKPRIHRVNGYLQNSCRVFTDQTTGSSGTSAKSYLVEKFSSSIRSRAARKRPQHRNPYHNLEQWSKFGSLESFFSGHTGRGAAVASSSAAMESVKTGNNEELTVEGQEEESCETKTDNRPGAAPASGVHLAANERTSKTLRPAHGSLGPESPTLFSFPLISLEEAARRQALGLDNGADNATITTGGRSRKESSVGSSWVTQRTTPPTPHIAKPLPTHRRRPTPIGIPSWAISHGRHSSSFQGMYGSTTHHSPHSLVMFMCFKVLLL